MGKKVEISNNLQGSKGSNLKVAASESLISEETFSSKINSIDKNTLKSRFKLFISNISNNHFLKLISLTFVIIAIFTYSFNIIRTNKYKLDINNWETYTNEKYGYELKYPSADKILNCETRKGFRPEDFQDTVSLIPYTCKGSQFTIYQYKNYENLSLLDYFRHLHFIDQGNGSCTENGEESWVCTVPLTVDGNPFENIYQISEITINDVKSLYIHPVKTASDEFDLIYIPKGNTFTVLQYTPSKYTRLIPYTFKFTGEVEVSAPLPYFKTTPSLTDGYYVYSNYDYSFKYPSKWKITSNPIILESGSPRIVVYPLNRNEMHEECVKYIDSNNYENLWVRKYTANTEIQTCKEILNQNEIQYWISEVGKEQEFGPGLKFVFDPTHESQIESIFGRILSSFYYHHNFLDWETYRNNDIKYLIKLPSDWNVFQNPSSDIDSESYESPDGELITVSRSFYSYKECSNNCPVVEKTTFTVLDGKSVTRIDGWLKGSGKNNDSNYLALEAKIDDKYINITYQPSPSNPLDSYSKISITDSEIDLLDLILLNFKFI